MSGRTSYEVETAIPELSAEVGDIVIVDWAEPVRLFVVKRYGVSMIPTVLDHVHCLRELDPEAEGVPQ